MYDDNEEVNVSIFKKYPIQLAMIVGGLVCVFIAGIIAGLGTSDEPKQPQGAIVNINNGAPANRGCSDMPKLTNDQIIIETNKCSAAGLDAEALHCGEDYQITIVQCKPKATEANG